MHLLLQYKVSKNINNSWIIHAFSFNDLKCMDNPMTLSERKIEKHKIIRFNSIKIQFSINQILPKTLCIK